MKLSAMRRGVRVDSPVSPARDRRSGVRSQPFQVRAAGRRHGVAIGLRAIPRFGLHGSHPQRSSFPFRQSRHIGDRGLRHGHQFLGMARLVG